MFTISGDIKRGKGKTEHKLNQTWEDQGIEAKVKHGVSEQWRSVSILMFVLWLLKVQLILYGSKRVAYTFCNLKVLFKFS